MQALIESMQTITNFETGNQDVDTAQLEALAEIKKRARSLVKAANADDQLRFLVAYCELQERVGHQDSFGIVAHLEHSADAAMLGVRATHGAELQALIEASARRTLNGGTLKTLRSYGTLARAVEVLETLRADGLPFVGLGGKPEPESYDLYLKRMRDEIALDAEDEDDEEEDAAD